MVDARHRARLSRCGRRPSGCRHRRSQCAWRTGRHPRDQFQNRLFSGYRSGVGLEAELEALSVLEKPSIAGLRVAVTGGTSGLGNALVRLLCNEGAHVAFVARTVRDVERVAGDTGALGIVGDVGRKDDIYPIALQIAGGLGGLDVLVNNASSLGPAPLSLLADTDCEGLQLALEVNLLGPFRLTKALFGALTAAARAGRSAMVINISSDAATSAYSGWGAYGASKAGLRHLTAIWDEEARAQGVRLLSVDPGDMDTPLHAAAVPDADPATLGRPEDSAVEIVERMRPAAPGAKARAFRP
ncbi:MAG: SDR family oxidoreductase [Rhodospirillales bacterium]|nr:SDR family oxidoreductase [Rhodospirillales bacterium]